MQRGDPALRHVAQRRRRQDGEEVDLHGIPVHRPQAGHLHVDRVAGDVEPERVAQVHAQGLRDALLHRHFGGVGIQPAAGHVAVVARQLVHVGQVELPVHQPLRAIVLVVGRPDPASVDLDQPPADHRVQLHVAQPRLRQALRDRLALVRLDVDQETVGRIGWRGAAPALDQVATGDGQQQDRHQPHRQGAYLRHRGATAADHARQRETQSHRPALPLPQRFQPAQPQPRNAGKQQEASQESPGDHQAQLQVAREPEQQQREAHRAHPVAQRGPRRSDSSVAAQDAGGRDVAQLGQRRQREAHQQPDTSQEPLYRGQRPGARQVGRDQAAQRGDQALVRGIAERAADGGRPQRDDQELGGEQPGQRGLRRPQAAHDRHAIEMPQREAPRGQRDGHRRDQGRQQRHQRQELLRPVDGAAHLGPAGVQRLHALAALRMDLQPGGILARRRRLPRRQQAVGDAAAEGHQARRRQVVLADHDPRRHVDEIHAPIGLHRDHPGDAEMPVAQLQVVAHAHVQQRQQLRIHPGGPGRGNLARRLIGRGGAVGHAQAAAQRVARPHRLQGRQLRTRGVAGPDAGHGRELQVLGHRQPEPARFVARRLIGRIVGNQHDVAAQQLGGVAFERLADAVGQEAHAGNRGHGDDQRHRQQPEFPGAPVAHGHAPGLGQEGQR